MTFKKKDGVYVGIIKDGRQVAFSDKTEMRECAKIRASYLRMFGLNREADCCIKSMIKCVRRNARYGLASIKKKSVPVKKNVRLTIDPDVEYLGNAKFVLEKEKALA